MILFAIVTVLCFELYDLTLVKSFLKVDLSNLMVTK